jgi:hypothetical protein
MQTVMLQRVAVVTIGFVKDAKDHVNIQGFNIYHKNPLIKLNVLHRFMNFQNVGFR